MSECYTREGHCPHPGGSAGLFGRPTLVFLWLIIGFILVLGAGCASQSSPRRALQPPPRTASQPSVQTSVQAWEHDPSPPRAVSMTYSEALSEVRNISLTSQGMYSWKELTPMLRASLDYARKQPAGQYAYDIQGLRLTWAQVCQTLDHLLELIPRLDKNQDLLGQEFTWYRIEPTTLLTGYYEPVVHASLTKAPGYPYPIYKQPPELKKKGAVGPTREAIDFKGALKGRGLEIAWAKDLVEVFFLQIQGSGRLLLPDGSQRRILYGGNNGRKYIALGSVLMNRGYMTKEQVNMPALKDFLRRNPSMVPELLSTNPRYIFFRMGEDGPFGATGAKLAPLTCVAVAPQVIPMGVPLMLDAQLPAEDGQKPHRLTGLTFSLDRGAMKGNHLDLFCGVGDQAEAWAGRLKHPAQVNILVSKRVK